MTPATKLTLAGILILPALAFTQPAGDLAVASDSIVASTLVDQVSWLADERGLVIGGWREWPSAAQIIVAEAGKPPVALDRAASPRFALSPSRQEIAYWVATGAGWCQLAIVPLAGTPVRYLGEPRHADDAVQIAWPTQGRIVALFQQQAFSRAVALDAKTGGERVLVEAEGGEWVRLRKWPGSDPIAVWAGNKQRCFRLAVDGQSEEVSEDADADCARPSAPYRSAFDAQGALVVTNLRDGTQWRPQDRASAACWSPDGETLYAAREDALLVLAPETHTGGRIFGSSLDSAGPAPRGISCSGDGGCLAYWRPFGGLDQVRLATLARERVTITAAFATGVAPAVGQHVFVATELYSDSAGSAKEPVWSTVKGEFAVLSSATDGNHVIVQAVSVGKTPGVLKRLTGLNAAPADAHALAPLPDLRTWLQGTKHTGKVTAVQVEQSPVTG